MDHADQDPDVSHLATLSSALGEDLATVVSILSADLERGLEGVDRALAAGDLAAAARAAHAARNGALMLDHRPLLELVAMLENAARSGALPDVLAARGELSERWPALREALARVAAGR